MSMQDNVNWAVRKAAASWAATKAERPIWAGSVLTLDEAIENAESDLEDRSILDPFFFLLSKATGKNSRLIVATEIVVNQVQAHPSWFANIKDAEKFGDLDPDKLAAEHLSREREKESKGKKKEKKQELSANSGNDVAEEEDQHGSTDSYSE